MIKLRSRKLNLIISCLTLAIIFALAPFCNAMAMNKAATPAADSSSQNMITQDCSLHPTSQAAANLLKQGQTSGQPANCCLNKPNLSEIMQAEKQSSLHPELVLILDANPISDNNKITNTAVHLADLSPPSQNVSLLSVIKKE